jgi:transcriptional regulator with XRE-family HTH domain
VNERLRTVMASQAVSVEALAERAGVDLKTAQRWLAGRTPHARHRWAAAALLCEDETYLWPETAGAGRTAAASTGEVIRIYPRRVDASTELWWRLLTVARDHVDVLVYAANFLPEQYPALVDVLREKCDLGCRVRLALGDPEHTAILARGEEERFGDGIASRVRNALRYYAPLVGRPGAELRVHATTLYNSIYRFDDVMLVNTHVYGLTASQAPLLHLRRLDGGALFDSYLRSFQAAWDEGRPYAPDVSRPTLQVVG